MTLTIDRGRPFVREGLSVEQAWAEDATKKEDISDPKKFKAKCTKCGVVTRSDKKITEETLCICEQVPKDKRLITCSAGHYELLAKNQLIMKWSCKKCEQLVHQQTPKQKELSRQIRTRFYESYDVSGPKERYYDKQKKEFEKNERIKEMSAAVVLALQTWEEMKDAKKKTI